MIYPIPSTTYLCTQIQNQAELVELTILNAPLGSMSTVTDEWSDSKHNVRGFRENDENDILASLSRQYAFEVHWFFSFTAKRTLT